METVRGLVELTRPGNALMAGGLTLIGAFVAGGLDAPSAATFAVVATMCATGAGNGINDYFDRDIDAINRPDRPIPRGSVSPREALWFSVGLFVVAVGLTLLLPLLAIAIALVNLVALVTYTELFKGLPGVGNAVVAGLGGSTFLYGGAAVGGELAPVLVLFGLAACATFAREVVKDVEDIEGDREEGLNTLPIAIGERRALGIATVAVVAALIASPLPYLLGTFDIVYLYALAPAAGVMIVATYRSFSNPTTGQTLLKVGMLLAALAFVVGRGALFV